MSLIDLKDNKQCPILGLPKHGKTVFFVTACEALASAISMIGGKSITFAYSSLQGADTTSFVYYAMSKLRKQEWPEKTTDSLGYSCQLRTQHLLNLVSYTRNIKYYDFAGEAYDYAFGGVQKQQKISSMYKEQSERLIDCISSCDCAFIVIDAEKVYNRDEDDLIMMSNLIERIRTRKTIIGEKEYQFSCKIGIIFNKLEVVPQNGEILDANSSLSQQAQKFERVFAERYHNAYAWLKNGDYRFFPVWTLGSVEKNNNGIPIPPKKLQPRGVLEPFEWMLGISLNKYQRK